MSLDVSEVLANITKLNRSIRENESQWRSDASQMDDWSSSQEGLESRMSTLNRQIDDQKKKVKEAERLKEAYIEQYGEESAKVDEANGKIIRYQKELERSQKELKSTQTSLDKLNNELGEQDTKSGKAEKATKELNREVEKSDKSFGVATVAIGGFIANGLTAMVSSIGSAISSLAGLADSTLEYRREIAALTSVADKLGANGDAIVEKWMDVNSVINDEQSVTEGINNLLSAGFTAEKEMDAITKALEGASLQWKDTLRFEGLSDSLQEWIGSGGANLTGQFAELLERLGYNLEDVTAQTKGMTDEQRRQWAITTLNKNGMSELSDSYREANKDMIDLNRANMELTQAQANLGEVMTPMVASVKSSFADILYSFTDMVSGVDGAGYQLMYNIGYLAGSIYKEVQNAIQMFMPLVKDIIPQIVTFITENLPVMLAQGVSIISSMVDGIAQNIPLVTEQISGMLSSILLTISENAPTLLNSALELFGQIVLAIPQMLVDLSATLPTIIDSIVEGLFNGEQSVFDTALDVLMGIVEAIPPLVVELVNNLPAIIDSITTSLSEAIPKVFAGAIELLGQIVDAIPDIIVDLLTALPSIITSLLNFLADNGGKILAGGVELLLNIVAAIPQVVVELGKRMPEIITAIKDGIVAGAKGIFNAGYDLIAGLVDGMFNFDIGGKLKSLGKGILDGIKNFFGIHSPSRVMAEEVGEPIVEGVAVGMEDAVDEVVDVSEEIAEEAVGGFTKGWQDAIDGNVRKVTSSTEKVVKEAGEVAKKTAESVGTEVGTTVNDVIDTVMNGTSQDLASKAMDMVGSFAGPWGALVEAIYDAVMDNLVNADEGTYIEISQQFTEKLLDGLMTLLENLPAIAKASIQFTTEFTKGLIKGIPLIIKELPRIIGEICETLISDGIPQLFEVGAELITGLIEGMFSINLWDVIKGIGNGIVNGFKKLFGIHSPSKVMADEVGKNLALGMAEGLTNNLKGVNDAIRDGVNTSVELDQKVAGRKYVTVNQTNNYSQAHSRYEIYKSKRDVSNAVRLAMGVR